MASLLCHLRKPTPPVPRFFFLQSETIISRFFDIVKCVDKKGKKDKIVPKERRRGEIGLRGGLKIRWG